MKSINRSIRNFLLEIILVIIFLISSIPLWEYMGNPTYAKISNHYIHGRADEIVISNRKKYVFSETYEEAIRERNFLLATSYRDNADIYSIYLLLKAGTNYDDIFFSNGVEVNRLSSLYDNSDDEYIYFKIEERKLDFKETIKYYYYIWSSNLKKDKNIKIKFAII